MRKRERMRGAARKNGRERERERDRKWVKKRVPGAIGINLVAFRSFPKSVNSITVLRITQTLY